VGKSAADSIPDRLIELAQRWSEPFAIQSLLFHMNERSRDRQAIRETSEMIPQHPELAERLHWQVAQMQPNADVIDRRVQNLGSELQELETLVQIHTPDLLGNYLGYVGPLTKADEFIRGMRTLLGSLLARSRGKECDSKLEPHSAAPSAPAQEKYQPLFDKLAALAEELHLIGNEQRIVMELCKQAGRVNLTDLVSVCRWSTPWKDTWNAARIRLNKKLRKKGWGLHTRNGFAVAEPTKASARK
jgi:hypothetical protein